MVARWWIGLGLAASCQYSSPDAAVDAPPMPDAGDCTDTSITCVGDVLRTCAGQGATSVQETCTWGCNAGTPHCERIRPAANAIVPGDLDPTNFIGITPMSSLAGTIDGGLGTINGVSASTLGIGYTLLANGIAVFRFQTLDIGVVKLTGTHAIAIAADGPITITGPIDATGQCAVTPELAGAGGGNGGATTGVDGQLAGGGNGGANASNPTSTGGGGGGGWGAAGGTSGGGEAGGQSSGDATIPMLRGGAGGGAGVGNAGFKGGGGGGALQLVSNASIEFKMSGSINAGGCGGLRGQSVGDQGGGGGAGGTIVLEAPIVILGSNNALAVNGGGGAGGGGTGAAQNGQPGGLSQTAAAGGNGAGGANGGAGGAHGALNGQAAAVAAVAPGGGGGAVGWIRINTRDNAGATLSGTMSPAIGEATASQGAAFTQ